MAQKAEFQTRNPAYIYLSKIYSRHQADLKWGLLALMPNHSSLGDNHLKGLENQLNVIPE